MLFLPLLLVSLLTFVATVRAEGAFVHPPPAGPDGNYQDNPRYQLGSTIDVFWNSNPGTGATDLVLIEDYPKPEDAAMPFNFVYIIKNNTEFDIMTWTVSLTDLSSNVPNGEDVVLYMATMYTGTTRKEISSHYFNVSIPDTLNSSPTSTSTSTTTLTSTTSTSTTTTPSSRQGSPTTTGASELSSSSSLSTAAIAGIAVGTTIAGIIALLGAGLLVWKHFKKIDSSIGCTKTQKPVLIEEQPVQFEKFYQQGPSEMSAAPVYYEAP